MADRLRALKIPAYGIRRGDNLADALSGQGEEMAEKSNIKAQPFAK
jgi:hypothetical protein